MSGYPFGPQSGTASVEVGRDPDSSLESLKVDGKRVWPELRYEVIYSLVKDTCTDETDYHKKILDLEIVHKQILFHKARGFTIEVIDTEELFQIRAHKEEEIIA